MRTVRERKTDRQRWSPKTLLSLPAEILVWASLRWPEHQWFDYYHGKETGSYRRLMTCFCDRRDSLTIIPREKHARLRQPGIKANTDEKKGKSFDNGNDRDGDQGSVFWINQIWYNPRRRLPSWNLIQGRHEQRFWWIRYLIYWDLAWWPKLFAWRTKDKRTEIELDVYHNDSIMTPYLHIEWVRLVMTEG